MSRTAPRGTFRYPLGLIGLCLQLQACTSAPPTLYQWHDYSARTHDYLQTHGNTADTPSRDASLKTMQDSLADFQNEKHRAPPGYHAHLGLLYAQQGDLAQYSEALETEKALFPESTVFMNYLMNNINPVPSEPPEPPELSHSTP